MFKLAAEVFTIQTCNVASNDLELALLFATEVSTRPRRVLAYESKCNKILSAWLQVLTLRDESPLPSGKKHGKMLPSKNILSVLALLRWNQPTNHIMTLLTLIFWDFN